MIQGEILSFKNDTNKIIAQDQYKNTISKTEERNKENKWQMENIH